MRASAALAATPAAALAYAKNDAAAIETDIVRLKLLHTWTTVMSSSDFRDTLHLKYVRDGVTGHGEGAPIPRYQETAASARAAIEKGRGYAASTDPWQFSKLIGEVFQRIDGQYAAKAALDIALMDWVGQKRSEEHTSELQSP